MKDKLELIIEDIGRKQIERFREKSADHFPGTEYDVASDNYNWDNDTATYWNHEVLQHFFKLVNEEIKSEMDSRNKKSEITAIIDLMNVLSCRLHKLELLEEVR